MYKLHPNRNPTIASTATLSTDQHLTQTIATTTPFQQTKIKYGTLDAGSTKDFFKVSSHNAAFVKIFGRLFYEK